MRNLINSPPYCVGLVGSPLLCVYYNITNPLCQVKKHKNFYLSQTGRTAKMAGGVHAPPIFTRGKWDLLYKPFLLDLMTVKRVAYYVDILRPTRATARTFSLARKCSTQ